MNGKEIRQAVLRYLVAHGEPLRGARGEPTWDVYERMGMQMHLSGDRHLLSVGSRRANRMFNKWMQDVPEGGCELMFERCSWEDTSWTVYSSYDETSWTERGVDVTVYCTCGKIAGAIWRYEGTWGGLLRGITEGTEDGVA